MILNQYQQEQEVNSTFKCLEKYDKSHLVLSLVNVIDKIPNNTVVFTYSNAKFRIKANAGKMIFLKTKRGHYIVKYEAD